MGRRRKYLVVAPMERAKICEAEWTRLRSRVDFMLAKSHPDFFASFTETGQPLGDKKCPRQEKPVRAEDLI